MEQTDIYEHIVVIDNTISVSIRMPKVLKAQEFKGFLAKINSIIKTTGYDIVLPEESKMPKPEAKIFRKHPPYTEEEKQFLRELATTGANKITLSEEFNRRFGRLIPPNTMIYHRDHDFEFKSSTGYHPRIIGDEAKFLLRKFFREGLTASQAGSEFKKAYNNDLTLKQIYSICYGHKKNNSPEYRTVMGGDMK
jgi:hypothetical protein